MNQESLHYRITGDAKGFKGAVNQSKKSLGGFQQQIKGAASNIKLLLAGALTAAGVQAIRSAKNFDKSMTQIKSLVGVAGSEVDKMAESVKDFSEEIGINANEAGDALFFITSAGLRGSEAMDVLEASMKAAKVGLGETKTIADLATSALNAYGSANLSATEATDVMVTAVREGKLEASELAQSMGRVLPLASAMGVEFHEVGAAFAALSRTGTNAAEASTQVRGILASLLKPTKQAEEALTEMGLSSKELRRQLKEEGLLATLESLKKEFEGNDEAAAQVFGNVRALSGVLDLMGANADGTRQIFDALTKSVGATSTAFEIDAKSSASEFDKALVRLTTSLLEIGEVVLPLVASGLELVADVVNFFKLDGLRKEFDDTTKSAKNLNKELSKVPTGADSPKRATTPVLDLSGLGGDKPRGTFNVLDEFNKTFKTNFEDISEITNDVQFELFLLNDTANLLTTTTRGMAEGLDFSKLKLLDFKTVVEETSKTQQQLAMVSNMVSVGMNLFFDALNDPEGFGSFLKGIKKVIAQLIKQLAIMTAISAVASALGLGSFKTIFGKISGIPGLAEGGIVTSPTLAMIGEGSQSEAVIPLNRLPQMLGATSGNTRGEFTLRGQDLILALERAGDFRARITG